MRVPIIRIPFGDEDLDFVTQGVRDVLTSGMLSQGKLTERFEEAFATLTGTSYCVSCSNGTTALELAIRGLGIENSEVIVPTNTFLACAFAVVHSGNRVVFADSDPETLCLDVVDVERCITPVTKAVMLVHIGGIITPAVDRLQKLCKERGIFLIEDCAHAHGSSIEGRPAGSLGDAAAFSFFPTKVMTTGEGGMLTTDIEEVAQRASMVRNHGKNPAMGNRMSEIGHNFRLSEITAVLGLEQVRRADRIFAERQRVAAFYDAAIGRVHGVKPVTLGPGIVSTYYKYVVYLDEGIDRAALKKAMREEHGVALTGEVYTDLCHTEPVWDRYRYDGTRREPGESPSERTDFPGAEVIAARHICLPVYPGLSEDDLGYVLESLDRAIDKIA